MLGNTFFGLAIGVGSSFLTLFCLFIWKTGIEPWVERLSFDGIDLSGIWVAKGVSHEETTDGKKLTHNELNLQLDLTQKGRCISGIFQARSVIAQGKEKEKYENVYELKGKAYANYVILEYHPLSRKRAGLGTFLMEVKSGGGNMIGDITFVEEGRMHIFTLREVLLNRVQQG